MKVKGKTAKQVANKVRKTRVVDARIRRTLKVIEDNPDIPTGTAMIAGGYSEATARNPGANFLNQVTVQQIADEMRVELKSRIGTKTLIKKIDEQLNAEKWYLSQTGPDFKDADYSARAKGIELALKVLSFGQPTNTGGSNNVQININTSKYTKD